MKITRRVVVLGALPFLAQCASADRARVVVSFSILGDLTRQLLGPETEVLVLVGADADSHVYDPSPADAVAISSAALLIENGLNFEPWLARLKTAGAFSGVSCIAADGIDPIYVSGTADPHAWHDVANVRRYVANIAAAASQSLPGQSKQIAERLNALDARLAALDAAIRSRLSAVPARDRVVVTSHDAFGYFGQAYGIRFLAPLGFSTDMEPRPDRVGDLIDQIRAEGVRALFLENMTDPRLLKAISAETGVAIGGTLYGDALSPPDGPAATYEALMRHNLERIATALA